MMDYDCSSNTYPCTPIDEPLGLVIFQVIVAAALYCAVVWVLVWAGNWYSDRAYKKRLAKEKQK